MSASAEIDAESLPARAETGPRVAMFSDALSKDPKETGLARILEYIRNGRWRTPIESIRATYSRVLSETGDTKKAKDSIAAAKKSLPAFCISGTAASRTEPLDHSGLLQVDLDTLGDTLETVCKILKLDQHVAFGFVSPSGDGLKLGLRIDGSRHPESFVAAEKYFRVSHGLEIDRAVKDPLRLCFVSYDPGLWTNPDAIPLPVSECSPESIQGDPRIQDAQSIIVLPSGSVSISESAREIFQRIAPGQEMFFRGGAIVELVEEDGIHSLDMVRPEAFRSRVEKVGRLMVWRTGTNGEAVLKPCSMPRDTAAAIMETVEARELLPPVSSVLRCPVMVEGDGAVRILPRGYHREAGGLLIVTGEAPPRVPVNEAAKALLWIVEQFDFQTEGDKSRALAAIITPALRAGGFISGNVPVDVAEADKSQAGKGYRHTIVCAIYNESGYIVTARQGGVGSVDESFAAALIAGRPFICLDNFRGRLESQHLEAFLTCPGLFPARIPHRGEIRVNPKRFILQMSSNGMEATRDLVNRASICRIRRRPGFTYRETLVEIQSNQPHYLGCVFSIIAEWVANGKPKTADTRHDFREWNQTLDWIVQSILGCAPLMDGHEAAQERASNPALSWLRAVALAVAGENRLGSVLTASEISELCDQHGLVIPGLKDANEETAKRQVGIHMRRVFTAGDSVAVDGFTVVRAIRSQSRTDGGPVELKTYTITKP